MDDENFHPTGYQLLVIEAISTLTNEKMPIVGPTLLKKFLEEGYEIDEIQWNTIILPIIDQLIEQQILIKVRASYGFFCKQTKSLLSENDSKAKHNDSKCKNLKPSKQVKNHNLEKKSKKSLNKTKNDCISHDSSEDQDSKNNLKKDRKIYKKFLGPKVEITSTGRISYKHRNSSSSE